MTEIPVMVVYAGSVPVPPETKTWPADPRETSSEKTDQWVVWLSALVIPWTSNLIFAPGKRVYNNDPNPVVDGVAAGVVAVHVDKLVSTIVN